MKIATGAQIRMARAYLRWSAEELAQASGVGLSTIKRIEKADDLPDVRTANLKAVCDALLKTGKIRFDGDKCVCIAD
ncbi:helix-turn-helix transcriptional regulator [Oceanicoccus sp. KOV_DT_Chl]|uniref:helix-turn-helix transcriptional regulator n=1 Tax=Oceanicoccus sp. KOV_DT_Chl TaxID=1904639 RepID=UPI00135A1684|nr:helix-turn-helix transcriptional regulator [Oceanicoccus sp. KOV_DT_Chl]